MPAGGPGRRRRRRDEMVELTVETIASAADTGRGAEGKIYPVERAVRIQMGETDEGAV